MKDAGVVLHRPKGLLKLLHAFVRHQVALVQEQDVAVDHLGPSRLGVEHRVVEVLSINQRDDGIESC